jgi:hypothetical protein
MESDGTIRAKKNAARIETGGVGGGIFRDSWGEREKRSGVKANTIPG